MKYDGTSHNWYPLPRSSLIRCLWLQIRKYPSAYERPRLPFNVTAWTIFAMRNEVLFAYICLSIHDCLLSNEALMRPMYVKVKILRGHSVQLRRGAQTHFPTPLALLPVTVAWCERSARAVWFVRDIRENLISFTFYNTSTDIIEANKHKDIIPYSLTHKNHTECNEHRVWPPSSEQEGKLGGERESKYDEVKPNFQPERTLA